MHIFMLVHDFLRADARGWCPDGAGAYLAWIDINGEHLLAKACICVIGMTWLR